MVTGVLALLLFKEARSETKKALYLFERDASDTLTEFKRLLAAFIVVWPAFWIFTGGELIGSEALVDVARVFFIIPLIIFINVLYRWWRRFTW